MEYARHKRRKRRRARRNAQGGEAGRVVLALVMIAAIVYLVCASTAGTWIANNVVVPVFSMIDDMKAQGLDKIHRLQTPDDTPVPTDMQVSLNDTKQAVEFDVTLPAMTCYALQMGVFSSAANAQAQALSLQGGGAGGYVMHDGERYRVLSAAYPGKDEAASVRDAYISQGVDCTVYTFATSEATYRVSALEEQLDAVNAGFASIANAQRSLTELAASPAPENGSAELTRIAQALRDDMAFLSGYEGGHAALGDLVDCYKDCLDAIENAAKLSASGGTESFAANIKHAQLFVTDRYAQLMQALSYAGSTPSAAS